MKYKNRLVTVIALILSVSLLLSLSGCSKDTYSQQSTSKNFKLIRIVNVNLSCPGLSSDSDISVDITSDNGQDFVDLVTLITGKKLDTLPESHNFGLSLITYTTKYSETITVYPPSDGSNYMCLFSLNESTCKYIELPEKDMDTIEDIFVRYGVSMDGKIA